MSRWYRVINGGVGVHIDEKHVLEGEHILKMDGLTLDEGIFGISSVNQNLILDKKNEYMTSYKWENI